MGCCASVCFIICGLKILPFPPCPPPPLQLAYSYSANGKVPSPCHLHLVGWKGDIKARGEAQITGMANWLVTRTEADCLQHFAGRTEKLVYLTADSENELVDVDPTSIYIIGGLVDHNRCVGLLGGVWCYRQLVLSNPAASICT